MKKRWTIVMAAAVVLVLGAGAGALYGYDASRSDRVAHGVVVAGVDIGGLTSTDARRRLQAKLAPQVERAVTVEYRDRRWVLDPGRAQLHADVDGMVNAALDRSRKGTFIGRALRELRGGTVRARLPLRVTYSQQAIATLVRRVSKTVARPARSATIDPNGYALNFQPSHTGTRVLGRRLATAIARQFRRPGSLHVVLVPTTVVKPKVSSWKLAQKYPYYITIARSEFRLRFWDHLQLKKTYTIAVGRIGLETPAGVYTINDKQVDPSWHVPHSAWAGDLAGRVIPPGPDDPLKARWMGFYDGAGIHGTDDIGSLGSAASHGCIRMAIPDVIELYNMVPLHTPIYVG